MLRVLLLMFVLECFTLSLGEKDIIVVDGILTEDDLNSILTRFGEEDVLWNFHDVTSKTPEVKNDSDRSIGAFPASHHWMARLVPEDIMEGDFKPIWAKLKQQVAANLGVKDIHLHRGGGQISSRGDTVVPTYQCSSHLEGRHVLLVLFVVQKWDKNSYGEMVVYGNDGEIFKSIHPRSGRLVIVPCKYKFVIKPPSMDCADRLRTVTLHVSSSKPLQLFNRQELKKYMYSMYNLHSFQALKSTPFSNPTLDVTKYLTRQFITTKGHPVLVFDDLIAPEIINNAADTMIKGIYVDNPPGADSTDNVPWILGFEIEAVVSSPLWHYAQAIVQYASKKEGYYPYDISCNSIRSHDSTRIHLDCGPHQDEYTMLIYLNRNWTENDHGETVFFDYDHKEMVFAVKPKFGRVAIFQGTIPHSARPPSPKLHSE